jgi:hypothetical protein
MQQPGGSVAVCSWCARMSALHPVLPDFEKLMLHHIHKSAMMALELYNNTEGVRRNVHAPSSIGTAPSASGAAAPDFACTLPAILLALCLPVYLRLPVSLLAFCL